MAGEMTSLNYRGWLYHPDYPDYWKRCSLYSMAQWVNGLAFRNIQFSSAGMPVIKIAEIKGGITGQTKFTQQVFDGSVRVQAGDLLFSWSGQPETSLDAFWWRGPEGWLNQHVFRVTPADGIDPTFFYYLLRYLKPNFVGIARNKQTTGLGHVTKRDLENIEAGYPDLTEQRAIAHILGTLDDKIELNRRMSETLEAMARALFKSWFIDFDPVRRNAARARNQPSPSTPRHPLPAGEGLYRGGYDYAGLVRKARELRAKQTPAEALLWELVRDRRFMGLKFRRQHQLGDYIADYYCHEHRLVVELDGGIHAEKRAKDHKRDAWMAAQGIQVLRFSNEQLLEDPQSVLLCIAVTILPSPLGRGARGEPEGHPPSPSGRRAGDEGVVAGEAFDHLFPARLVDSELGEIPEGWDVGLLESAVVLQRGFDLPASERTPGKYPVMAASGPTGTHAKFMVRGPGVTTGRSGVLGKVFYVADDFWPLNTSLWVREFRRAKPAYAFHLLNRLDFAQFNAGSAVPTLNRNHVHSLPTLIPPAAVVEAFERFATRFLHRQSEIGTESATLTALRDALLPKLISGELRVKDVGQVPHISEDL